MKAPGRGAVKRIALEALGWLLILAGIAALILPGPGLLLLAAGLVLLSQEYEWAEKRVEPVKRRALRAAAESVATNVRVAVSTTLALLLGACGVVWILDPDQPDWWSLPEASWLPGGWATGVTQLGSALVALGMIVYSYRRFRVRGESVPG
jgi:hypothetical protein